MRSQRDQTRLHVMGPQYRISWGWYLMPNLTEHGHFSEFLCIPHPGAHGSISTRAGHTP